MSREGTLLKNVGLFFIGNFSSKILIFLLLPLYTEYLLPEEYGYSDLIFTSIAIIVPLITLQIFDGIYRYTLEANGDRTKIKKTVSNSFAVCVTGVVFFTLGYLIFITCIPIQYEFYLLCYLFINVISGYYQQISRALKNNVAYTIAGLVLTIINIACNIVFIVGFGMKVNALLLSAMISEIAAILYLESKIKLLSYLNVKLIKKDEILILLRYSIPLLPNSICWWLISSFNRFFLAAYVGVGAVGIYAVANKFPSLLATVNQIFSLAWQESAITEYTSKERDAYYTKIFNLFMSLQVLFLTFLLPVTKYAITLFIEKEYSMAWVYIPFLYFGAMFSSFSSFYGVGYLSAKKTKNVFTTTIVAALLNIILSIALVPFYGGIGVAISNMLSFFILWILRLRDTRKLFRIEINIKNVCLLVLILFITVITYYNIDSFYISICISILCSSLLFFLHKELLFKLTKRYLSGSHSKKLMS